MKQILMQFRVLLLVVIPAIIFTGCQSDNLDERGPVINEKEVIFSINVPKTSPPSSMSTFSLGDTEENEIATIEMLLFKAGKVAHNPVFANTIKSETTTTKSFSVKLPEGTFDIMIFANSRKAFNSVTIALDDLQEETLAKLTVDLPATGWIADKGDANKGYLIPMWGIKKGLDIGTGTTITGIYMHRMLSRIDLSVTGSDSETGSFKLLDIKVYNPQTKGRIAPIEANWDPNGVVNSVTTGKATKPSLVPPATKGTEISYKTTISADQKSNKSEIYIFEALQATGHADLGAPYITIQALFDGVEGWYRIDLADYSNMSYLDVLRNNLYRIEIKKVTGTGFTDEEDAKKNRADNIIVNITQWNEYDLGNIVFDGQYQLSLDPTTINTNRLPLVTNVTVATDHPELPTIGVWSDIDGKIALPGNWMSAMITAAGNDANGRKLYKLEITITENTDAVARTGYVHVKAGRLTNMVKVTQQEPKVRTIPTGGVLAEPNILAVNSKGELNLDGDGYIVFFKWGSLIALSSDARAETFPEAVAWVPSDTYSAIHKDFNGIAYQSTGNYPTTENSTTAIGDPCRLATKNGEALKNYKTPSADHKIVPTAVLNEYMGAVTGDYGGFTTSGGRQGYMYKGHTNGQDMQFYPLTGVRSHTFDNHQVMYLDRGFYSSTTTNPTVGLENRHYVLYFRESHLNTQNSTGMKQDAYSIRCVEDVKATFPTATSGGVAARVDILAVDAAGILNLDGRGKIVLFKWGSLVALSGDPLVNTYPEAIAWVPPTYNGMGSGFEVIPFADANHFPLTNNLQTGIGDPCKEAVKTGSAVGSYKMPAGNPYNGIANAADYGNWVAVNGINGCWYKEADATTKFFYPATGFRRFGNPLIEEFNTIGHFWSSTVDPGRLQSARTLYLSNIRVDVIHVNDIPSLAFPIRCVPK